MVIAFASGIRNWSILTGVICIQTFTSFFLFFRALISASQLFRVDAWLSVFDKFIMILLCGALLLFPATFGYMTIGKFIFLQATCLALAIFVAAWMLFKAGFRFPFGSLSFFKRSTIRSMLPYGLIILVMSLHYRLDGFLLERMHPDGAYQAGLYASAYRLLDASNMVGFLFASFLLPYIARWANDPAAISSVTLNIRHVLITFSIGIACTGIFLSPWIQKILYHNNDFEAIQVLKWCLPALIGYSLVHIYGTLLTATGHILPFCLVTFLAVVMNLVLNILLIPVMGAKGCCIAALVSQSACGIASMYYAKEKLGIPIHKDSLFIYIVIAGAVGLLFYWGGNSSMDITLLMAVAIVTAILIMIFTKLFRPSLWMQLFTKSQTGS
jgi:O-antigen/teichoic acid export membrane protein